MIDWSFGFLPQVALPLATPAGLLPLLAIPSLLATAQVGAHAHERRGGGWPGAAASSVAWRSNAQRLNAQRLNTQQLNARRLNNPRLGSL